MQIKKTSWLILVILMITSLTSCNIGKSPAPTPDVNAIFTSAAQTMVSQLNDQQTQTAQAVPTDTPTGLATFTSLPTIPAGVTPFSVGGTPFVFNTPTPGGILTPFATRPGGYTDPGFAVGCANAILIGEDPPDKTVFAPGKTFEKSWSLLNTGTCTWDNGFRFAFKSGDSLSADPLFVLINTKEEFTPPGHSQAFVIHMQAPLNPKEYKGYWQMKDDQGNWFGCGYNACWVDIIVKKP